MDSILDQQAPSTISVSFSFLFTSLTFNNSDEKSEKKEVYHLHFVLYRSVIFEVEQDETPGNQNILLTGNSDPNCVKQPRHQMND